MTDIHNHFIPFDGVRYELYYQDGCDVFADKDALLKDIGGYEPVYGVTQIEWNPVLQKPVFLDCSEAIAEEYVGRNYPNMLDDNGDLMNVEAFYAAAAERCHRSAPRSRMAYTRGF